VVVRKNVTPDESLIGETHVKFSVVKKVLQMRLLKIVQKRYETPFTIGKETGRAKSPCKGNSAGGKRIMPSAQRVTDRPT